MISDKPIPNSLDVISKQFLINHSVARITGPLSLRLALGLSQPDMGKLLGGYSKKRSYTRSTISLWERVERGERLPVRYAMTAKGREAYRQLLAEAVVHFSDGRYLLKARMGQRVWHFELEAQCPRCGRLFHTQRWGIRRCIYCRRKER